MNPNEPIAFSEAQQSAILGHGILRPDIFSALEDLDVDKNWFRAPSMGEFWEHVVAFRRNNNRYPITWEEVVDSIKDDDLYRKAATRSGDFCTEQATNYQWDILENKLVQWAKARVIINRVKEISQKYVEGKVDEAYHMFTDGTIELQKVDSSMGLTQDTFISSALRVKLEEKERLAEHEKILPYGIDYLNDCLRGILPSDVVLLGAGTGIGKTEAAKICAAKVAKERKLDVHYFALEAENNEIERRIKYGMMGRWYREEHDNIPAGMISYANWRYNRLECELGPYKQRAEEEFKKDYSTLHTYYAVKGSFGIRDLEREIYKLKGKSSLVVLDHLHYIDLGENENQDMTKVVKSIKYMASSLSIPFILVAHIKKEDKRRGKELVPDLDAFHGTSNIVKICTQAIMLAPAWNFVSADTRTQGLPTFIRAVKVRVDGSAIHHTGLCFFDTYTNQYTPYYGVGKLDQMGNKWKPAEKYPFWASSERLITDCSEIG
jgi:replicative DNA helicase